ncbi:MAG TPA: hypothetical protein VMI72_04500 [Roseiarcus sp.]|nr:hypothetical protein [Roseiarcus sp.]
MAHKLCRAVFWLYAAMAAFALLLIPISAHGLFAVEPSPLAGVFAVLLAQPWLSLASDIASENAAAWNLAIVGGCLVPNAAILRLICRLALCV